MPDARTFSVYLIGGTTEAHRTAQRLQAEGFQVTVSVATRLGAALSAEATDHEADTGPKDAVQMARRAAEVRAEAVIDCSHPFAEVASQSARQAAGLARVPYFRFSRPTLALSGANVLRAGSWSKAVKILKDHPGRALLTVGTRHLELFVREQINFTARVLPLPSSLAQCASLGLEPRRIIAAYPPFSVLFNRACIRHAGADILVTKESGREGGLAEKDEAADAEGIGLLVVDRPPQPEAIHDLDMLVQKLHQAVSP